MSRLVTLPCFLLSVSLSLASNASAAQWAKELFPVKAHDFGTVAVAAKTEFEFPIQNTTNKDIHISSVRASCGCTTPILEEQWIKAGEEGTLIARFNTASFHGKKGATLTVVIDRPSYAEVQLRVDGYIRRDIVFNPGEVDFGKVDAGQGAQRQISLAYAGRNDWQIMGLDSTQPFLSAAVEEKGRSGQRVDYEILVTLAENAPHGFFRDEIVIRTNDRSMPRVPLAVSGDVQTAISVAPQAISVGALKSGEESVQKLVVRCKQPRKITEISCDGLMVDYTPSDEAKTVHLVTVRLVAGEQAGVIKAPLVVKTDVENEWSDCAVVTGEIVAP